MTTHGQIISPYTESIWYSYSGNRYAGQFPDFFDASDIAGLQEISGNFGAVRNEILSSLSKQDSMQPYFNLSMVKGTGTWDVVHVIKWGKPNMMAVAALPITYSTMKGIPGLLSLGIAKLAGHTEIKPHVGDTNAIIRCHLGIQIPGGIPDCGIEVRGSQRTWEEGKWIAFCDAHEHRSWNNTATERYVIIADILHDMFRSDKDEICRNVLSYHLLQNKLQKQPWLNMLPGKARGLLRRYYKNKL